MRTFWIITMVIIILVVGYTSLFLWIDLNAWYRWLFYIPTLFIVLFPCTKYWYNYYNNLFK